MANPFYLWFIAELPIVSKQGASIRTLVKTYYTIEAFCEQNAINRFICLSSQIKMFCILICIQLRILVPKLRGRTFGVIINIFLISNN